MQMSTRSQALLVREYTSFRLFSKDATALYARTGYTVMNTSGMPKCGLRALFNLRPHEERLVITYQAPSNPRPGASETP